MDQHSYELILRCIRLGAPVLAEELITALNHTVKLANERIKELEEQSTENKESK